MSQEQLFKWVPITEDLEFQQGKRYDTRTINGIREVGIPVQAISLEEHEKAVKDAYEKGHEHGYNQANTYLNINLYK